MKTTDQTFTVKLERPKTKSYVSIPVQAVSTAQAMRRAENEMKGWRALHAQENK